MKYIEIEPLLKKGRIGMLPHYNGYFKYSFGMDKVYMKNNEYVTFDIDKEKERDDWYYII